MRRSWALLASAALCAGGARAERREITLWGGWLGGGVSVTASELRSSRFGLRFGVGAALTDAFEDGADFGAGSFGAYKAARGLSEQGVNTTLGVDGLCALGSFGRLQLSAYLGGRANFLKASYGGGDDVSSVVVGQFGLGGGALLRYDLGGAAVAGDLGAWQYFAAPISGSAGGAGSVAAPGSPEYATADALVRQPKTVFKLKIGLGFAF